MVSSLSLRARPATLAAALYSLFVLAVGCSSKREIGSGGECSLPAGGLACTADIDCSNYPPATCGASGMCVCQ